MVSTKVQEIYMEERKVLVNSFSNHYQKMIGLIFTLATGGIILSITFLEKIKPILTDDNIEILKNVWYWFGLSTGGILILYAISILSYYLNIITSDEEFFPENPKTVKGSNKISKFINKALLHFHKCLKIIYIIFKFINKFLKISILFLTLGIFISTFVGGFQLIEFGKTGIEKLKSDAKSKEIIKLPEVTKSKKPIKIVKSEEIKNYSYKVSLIQQILIDLDYNPGLIDGIYGTKTKKAIKAYEEINKLEIRGKADSEFLKTIVTDRVNSIKIK